MKWAVLLAGLLLCPVLAELLRSNRRLLQWVPFAIGFLPFVIRSWHLTFAPIAWDGWPGWPKGLDVSLLDFLCIAVLLSFRGRLRTTGIAPWLFYFFAVLLAVPLAAQKMAAFFYVWQLVRMILVFLAVLRLASVPHAGVRLLHGVIAGVVYQAAYALPQFSQGEADVGGAFGAKNLLGIMTNFALVPSVALLLVRGRAGWASIGAIFSVVLIALSASRATLGLAAIGVAVMLAFSCAKQMTGRKAGIAAAALLVAAVVGPLAVQSMNQRRGAAELQSSDTQRAAFNRAAWLIIKDHPFGVGPDHYVFTANVGGYSAQAGVAWNVGNRAAAVHNSYLLVLAETGLIGLVTMIFLLWVPTLRGIRAAFRYRNDPRSELLLGFSVALLVFSIHAFFEWAFVLFVAQYMFAIYAGIVVGLAHQLKASGTQAQLREDVSSDTPPVAPPATAPAS